MYVYRRLAGSESEGTCIVITMNNIAFPVTVYPPINTTVVLLNLVISNKITIYINEAVKHYSKGR